MAATSTGEPARKVSLLREELKRAWLELRGAQHSPGRAAAAVAIGLFVGCQPVPGTHTPVVLAVCLLLRLDAALAWVASNISIPFISVFLFPAEIQLGAYLHTGRTLEIDWANFALGDIFTPAVALFAFTGSAIIGGTLAVVGAGAAYGVASLKQRYSPGKPRRRYQLPAHAPAWWHAVERVASRYVPASEMSTPAQRSRFHYVRIKLLMDPVTRMIADLFGEGDRVLGEVLDVGTGRGQLPLVLLELGRASRARGFDWDRPKVDAANDAAEQDPPLDARFEVADMREAELGAADTVLLIDVLHYLTIAEQDAVIDRAAAAVRPGGRLIVREADSMRGWRSWATLAEELLFTALRFNRGARVRFRPAKEIAERLERAGLESRIQPAWGRTPFSNVLIVARRPPAG